jgi:hypothetical protein
LSQKHCSSVSTNECDDHAKQPYLGTILCARVRVAQAGASALAELVGVVASRVRAIVERARARFAGVDVAAEVRSARLCERAARGENGSRDRGEDGGEKGLGVHDEDAMVQRGA